MASTILFTCFLCLLLGAVFSLPYANQYDSRSVRSSDSTRATELIEKASELDVAMVLSREDNGLDIQAVKNLDSEASVDATVAPSIHANIVKRSRRPKRQVIEFHGCPDGMVGFAKQCMPFETYEQLLQGDEEET